MRPDHLQDDEIFDALSLESVTNQITIWSQTKATKEALEMKRRKAEGNTNRTNTAVKAVNIEAGTHDAMSNFHPQ